MTGHASWIVDTGRDPGPMVAHTRSTNTLLIHGSHTGTFDVLNEFTTILHRYYME